MRKGEIVDGVDVPAMIVSDMARALRLLPRPDGHGGGRGEGRRLLLGEAEQRRWHAYHEQCVRHSPAPNPGDLPRARRTGPPGADRYRRPELQAPPRRSPASPARRSVRLGARTATRSSTSCARQGVGDRSAARCPTCWTASRSKTTLHVTTRTATSCACSRSSSVAENGPVTDRRGRRRWHRQRRFEHLRSARHPGARVVAIVDLDRVASRGAAPELGIDCAIYTELMRRCAATAWTRWWSRLRPATRRDDGGRRGGGQAHPAREAGRPGLAAIDAMVAAVDAPACSVR